MSKIDGNCLEVCEATEFIAIVTAGDDGPHVVGNWGDYMRKIGITGDTIVLPAGRYLQTEKNLLRNNRVQFLMASRKVQGTRTPGQGYLIAGRGEIMLTGEFAEAAKSRFPWARGALVIHVESVKAQL